MNNDVIILENTNIKMVFDKLNYSLLEVSSSTWNITRGMKHPLSYKILIPIHDKRNNYIYGEKQIPSSYSQLENQIVFTWNNVVSEFGGYHDIKITLTVMLVNTGAVFSMNIVNNTNHIIESVIYPYLGSIESPSESENFRMFSFTYATACEYSITPIYRNLHGYFGVDSPAQYADKSPLAPFVLVRGDNEGLYAGIFKECSEFVAWHTELLPGYESSLTQSVPKGDTIDHFIRFGAVHMPYIMPDESRDLTPIYISYYKGGWQEGVDIYTEWKKSWFLKQSVPSWATEPHSWQQLHINSPEDELRMTYDQLVQVGIECASNGVKALQLVGWNYGGQDRSNPSHSADDRAGGYEMLKEAIADIQKLGVKVILFAKFTWADRSTNWFKEELVKYSIKDPYMDYYLHQGYMYQTPTQLLDINTHRLIPMCFLSEKYLEICMNEFRKCVDLGADGILFDECFHHMPAWLCFDESHGHRYGAPVYSNDNELIMRFSKIIPQDKEFLFAGEACYDKEMQVYGVSYLRSENRYHIPLSRYMSPESQFMTAVTGFNDRNMINQCLMFRYIISYEPYNFKGNLSDFPLTVDYGKKMDLLRSNFREYFWDGEFISQSEIKVLYATGEHYPTYSVFRNINDNSLGVVIVNYDSNEATVSLQDLAKIKNKLYRHVDNEEWSIAEKNIKISPFSAIVVI